MANSGNISNSTDEIMFINKNYSWNLGKDSESEAALYLEFGADSEATQLTKGSSTILLKTAYSMVESKQESITDDTNLHVSTDEICCEIQDGFEEVSKPNQVKWWTPFDDYSNHKMVDRSNSKYIAEIRQDDTTDSVYSLMCQGVHTFSIDLHYGSVEQNITLLDRIYLAQKFMSEVRDAYISCSVLPLISRRIPETGLLKDGKEFVEISSGDYMTVTADRKYARTGSKDVIYINFRHMIVAVIIGQDIVIDDIKLEVVEDLYLVKKCRIITGGFLKPRTQVEFPGLSRSDGMTFEEIEDITFLLEKKIDVLVVSQPGDPLFYETFNEGLKTLKGSHIEVMCMLHDDYPEEEGYLKWLTRSYSGVFLNCRKSWVTSQLGHKLRDIFEECYSQRKPLILNCSIKCGLPLDAESFLLEEELKYFFFYPDKNFLRKNTQDFMSPTDTEKILKILGKLAYSEITRPLSGSSNTGSDNIARIISAASYDYGASAILVCTLTGEMAVKISHFRPKCPIIAITKNKNVTHYLQICHNVFVNVNSEEDRSNLPRKERLCKLLSQGIVFAVGMNLLRADDIVIFCYKSVPNLAYTDKIVAFNLKSKELKNIVVEID